MTETTTAIPGYVTMNMSLARLARITWDVLMLASQNDLPIPGTVRLSHSGQEISLGFSGSQASFHALRQWAELFGDDTVAGERHTREDGQESIHCQVRFGYQGATVEVYAFIPAGETSPAT
jgi:hypothetical protein